MPFKLCARNSTWATSAMNTGQWAMDWIYFGEERLFAKGYIKD